MRMSKGYFLAEIEVTNPSGYETYRSMTADILEKYGGRFAVRGGDPQLLEGDQPASRIILIEFDSPEKLMSWYNSPEYQAALAIRRANSTSRAFCLIGV
jgi:uncharacterized protein (DUF1330 family)